jgi:hypothetical protein
MMIPRWLNHRSFSNLHMVLGDLRSLISKAYSNSKYE